MSIRLLAKVWELDVKGTEREVLQVMCDHADDHGREARPSIAYIAWKVGCDERTVIRHIKKMRTEGKLILERKARDHSPNVYRVNLAPYPLKQAFVPKGDAGADEFQAAKKRGDTSLSPRMGSGVTSGGERGDILAQRGDTAVSPEPSFEPSFEPKQQKGAAVDFDSSPTTPQTPRANVYESYKDAFGDFLMDQSARALLMVEELERYSKEWLDEAFKRTRKREQSTRQTWRAYQRLPYALPLLKEWERAGAIVPEQQPKEFRAKGERSSQRYSAPPQNGRRIARHDDPANQISEAERAQWRAQGLL